MLFGIGETEPVIASRTRIPRNHTVFMLQTKVR